MTQPDDERRKRGQSGFSAQDSLRRRLLSDAEANCLPMAHVMGLILREHLAESLTAQQDVALRTIRSLLDDGLMEIGDILGASDERIVPWDLSIDAVMKRIYDLLVRHYEERGLWDFTIWLGLTPAGKRLARELQGEAAD
ncbi:hypothetical protein [Mycobacterium persicum]|uniref:MarR family transcriptional regulator n=2 Tax=Mycobacterium persicum TaxID=1487726 RepID=A0AB38V0V0_9MYCO|nr:hypothetical protein [Mycobacterium persicum]VAZ79268.1 hypothetical protein LAUMK15_04806 [Mycobacterium persicum]VAZ85635.1 hypothetical protein LAUMK42_04473 [Mycobacterium persicum]VAZ98887.1 hypothetical protein LAUMK4_04395 [Mycobacterium persicum]